MIIRFKIFFLATLASWRFKIIFILSETLNYLVTNGIE